MAQKKHQKGKNSQTVENKGFVSLTERWGKPKKRYFANPPLPPAHYRGCCIPFPAEGRGRKRHVATPSFAFRFGQSKHPNRLKGQEQECQ